MDQAELRQSSRLPRIVTVGSYRDPIGLATDGLLAALRGVADVRHLEASGAPWSAPSTLLRTLRLAEEHDAELIHVLDARYAAVGRWIRKRRGLAATLSLSTLDVGIRNGWPSVAGSLGRFDAAFVTDAAVRSAVREHDHRIDVYTVPPVARALPWPDKRRMSTMTRLLRDIRPGRLVLGVPWPADRKELRWFRDEIVPLLEGGPMCLIIGAPSRRYARLMFGAQGLQHDFRVHVGPLDVHTVAAAARCIDLFAVPSGFGGLASQAETDLALALAMGGVPVVTFGEHDAPVLAHEQNAFVVEPDERAFVHTLNQVLSLPAVQRHALGEEFARFTLRRWPWSPAAEVYGDRFAALVGRPQIPLEFRAA